MVTGKHSRLLHNIFSSLHNWLIEGRDARRTQMQDRHLFLEPEHLNISMQRDPESSQSLEYDPLMDIKAKKTMYSGYDSWSKPYVDVQQEDIPLRELLQDPGRLFQKEVLPDHMTCVTHIHIPATNMEVRTVNIQTWFI